MMGGWEKLFESVREFIKRDDIEVEYREEKEYGFKKSEAPSVICRVKEAKTPDGLVLRVSVSESFYDDTSVSFQEVLLELYQNWMSPNRVSAYMHTGEHGEPLFSDQELFNFINQIYALL